MRKFLAMFFSVLFLACAPARTPACVPVHEAKAIRVFVDPRFPAGAKAGIYMALREWAEALRDVRTLTVHEDPTKPTDLLVTAGAWEEDEDGRQILGATSDLEGKEIRLDFNAMESRNLEWRAVMLHELGHAMGVEHYLYPGLMRPGYGGAVCIDQVMTARVERVLDVPKGSVHPNCLVPHPELALPLDGPEAEARKKGMDAGTDGDAGDASDD